MRKITCVAFILILLMLLVTNLAQAAGEPGLVLSRSMLGSGGRQATNASGIYLTGALGQPIAEAAASGEIALRGGFLSSGSTYIYYFPFLPAPK